MATNKCVTVLTPNGRRSNIKISPNSTILQVLEEVCQKYDFNPDEYDLKHYNQILDVNLIFRYSNISNNASLEMVKCKNPRKVSNVGICIQLENGDRLTGEYFPNVNITTILQDLNIQYNTNSAVIIYTQREICGKDFETVTLRSLGLGSGKALFRLLERNPDTLKDQAHVYVPSKSKVSKPNENEDDKVRPKPVMDPNKSTVLNPISIIKAKKEHLQTSNDTQKAKETENKITTPLCSTNLNKEIENENENAMEIHENDEPMPNKTVKEEIKEPPIEFLGERNALLFNQAGAEAIDQDDIPDDFFDLTVNDAKILLRDVKRMQSMLEDAPLITAAQRELEENKTKLNILHKYQQAVIRIQFPNQFVLQGLFGPLETVQSIKDFIKTYLEHPEEDFVLYTSPPRCDLVADKHLFDQNLVPTAIIYYSGSSDLKLEVKSKLTDPTIASTQAVKTR
ncbi:PREDICTED: tether containing UBX domain for GLUT4 [Ceratosolen solmsi marchali]|uniref:Tether containing UBX domain for GLUT4 n=1 Tax=Ceratosolen solmsi marchali TaxID=326594 RepID=A0AAJ6YE55_9HYME|nr:PREDICTED: tether containing UBX domain for GLUT4 [Ceratosolen solmsi marchali]